MKTKNSVLAFVGLALATGFASLAPAQTASDVSCTKCVDTSDIANNAITTGRIKNGSVTNADVAFDAITSNRIRNGTVSNADLAPDAITSSRIKNGSITNADIATDNITGNRIKNGSLTGVDLADGSVTTDDIADSSITTDDIADSSITTDDIADGSITEQDIADGTITAAKLAGDAIYRNIYLVRADALDPAGNCQQIADILATFPAMNLDPALIKLEPGLYDCSNGGTGSGLVMKDFVDIEGSGQGTTVIQGDADSDGEGVVQTAANAELRFLTVDNILASGTHAIWAPQFARLSFVSLDPADGNGANETIDCGGNSDDPAVVVSNSIVTSNDQATFDCNTGGVVFIATQIAATQGFGSSGHICHASFDGAYVPFDNGCVSTAPPLATSQPANSDSRSRR